MSPEALLDALLAPIAAPERAALAEAREHNYSCRCPRCLSWWAYVGPDDDRAYGPFTEAEVAQERQRLGLA